MTRKTWPGYVALYKSKRGDKIVVRSITKPPPVRKFKVAGGIRNFYLIKSKKHLQEVLIVARTTKKPAKKAPAKKRGASRRKKQEDVEVTDDEIDELESVDELDEDEDDLEEDEDEDLEEEDEDEEEDDEDEPEDEDEDDEEDEDEDDEEDEEPPKRSRKPRQSRAAADGKVGTNEIAQKAGVDSRTLRMVLRKHKVKKDSETRRYQWSSFKHPTVVKILKWLEDGEADDVKTESLDKLKKTQEAKRAKSGKKAKKPAAKKRRRKVVEEDEDDE